MADMLNSTPTVILNKTNTDKVNNQSNKIKRRQATVTSLLKQAIESIGLF